MFTNYKAKQGYKLLGVSYSNKDVHFKGIVQTTNLPYLNKLKICFKCLHIS